MVLYCILVNIDFKHKSLYLFERALVDHSKTAPSQFCLDADILSFDLPIIPWRGLCFCFWYLPFPSLYCKCNNNRTDDERCEEDQQRGFCFLSSQNFSWQWHLSLGLSEVTSACKKMYGLYGLVESYRSINQSIKSINGDVTDTGRTDGQAAREDIATQLFICESLSW